MEGDGCGKGDGLGNEMGSVQWWRKMGLGR